MNEHTSEAVREGRALEAKAARITADILGPISECKSEIELHEWTELAERIAEALYMRADREAEEAA